MDKQVGDGRLCWLGETDDPLDAVCKEWKRLVADHGEEYDRVELHPSDALLVMEARQKGANCPPLEIVANRIVLPHHAWYRIVVPDGAVAA